ncbi:peptidoglycan editing factor PgeF [Ectothiorhodospira lacustris]|uniref:peptidoglycan editing factor PgeF n=1 Tax=Ectothiorhodospira lacustris TaxID=2899127 RepID=UPI001EE835A8|nr:peptidoglycan editing factor PgeF [Ectothiorhodospira lacustris]MCG5510838.1 peptidoglycan editing factor PgeF [Ectothiorhodospira lacustris]MCG5522616.1 peptidoglycan editing factor PgeF [Ectothiorhodospira lacustris]
MRCAEPGLLVPAWPAPAGVRSISTTRAGGVSRPPFDDFNLGLNNGDDPKAVIHNRRLLRQRLGLPREPCWLHQVHGIRVVETSCCGDQPAADAVVAFAPGPPCVVMTADCLPVLFCDHAGTRVGAAHAGWRGLAGGVLEATVEALGCPPGELMAWLGPCIGPGAFEVGDEVRAAFLQQDPGAHDAFAPSSTGRWLADLRMLARRRLSACGLRSIQAETACTFSDARRFYSFRRDGETGRMATLIWLVD